MRWEEKKADKGCGNGQVIAVVTEAQPLEASGITCSTGFTVGSPKDKDASVFSHQRLSGSLGR